MYLGSCKTKKIACKRKQTLMIHLRLRTNASQSVHACASIGLVGEENAKVAEIVSGGARRDGVAKPTQ